MRLTRMIATAVTGAALTLGSLTQPGVAAGNPYARGPQPTHAAIDQTIADPTAGPRIDASRQAAVGSSMGGGGGTLEAVKARPGLEARIGLVPFNSDKSWPEVEAASLEIGAEDDAIAPPRNHGIPFYESLWNAERRA